MKAHERTYKLCFYCHCIVTVNNRIPISSIKNVGLKYNISNKLKNMPNLIDSTDYEPNLIHIHCYNAIASKLGYSELA